MKFKKNTIKVFLVFSAIVMIASCKNDKKDMADDITMSNEIENDTVNQKQAPNLSTANFTVILDNMNMDEITPTGDLFLDADFLDEKVFIAKAPSYFPEEDKERWKALQIPQNSIFAFNTYHAGGGYYYYALVEGQKLKLYRFYKEEANPDNPERKNNDYKYELYKEFVFNADSVETIEYEKKGA